MRDLIKLYDILALSKDLKMHKVIATGDVVRKPCYLFNIVAKSTNASLRSINFYDGLEQTTQNLKFTLAMSTNENVVPAFWPPLYFSKALTVYVESVGIVMSLHILET